MTDHSKLKHLAEEYLRLIDDPDEDLWAEARDAYEDAADADTVLALINECDALQYDISVANSVVNATKADNERLERRDQMLAEVGCEYCGGSGWVHRIDGECVGVCDSCPAYELNCTKHELSKLKDENEIARMRIKEMDLLFGRYILAMRAAVIEEEHGLGADGAMMWIYNSLVGPGQLPPEDATNAQAYFDAEIVAVDNGMQEVLAFHDARRAAKEASNV